MNTKNAQSFSISDLAAILMVIEGTVTLAHLVEMYGAGHIRGIAGRFRAAYEPCRDLQDEFKRSLPGKKKNRKIRFVIVEEASVSL
jgi:hypothetical protein